MLFEENNEPQIPFCPSTSESALEVLVSSDHLRLVKMLSIRVLGSSILEIWLSGKFHNPDPITNANSERSRMHISQKDPISCGQTILLFYQRQ